ncbi:CopG family transcriptional regulator [Aminobacter carboxidus]|uniref:CopG family transcriptional regulator n=2 Tax=Aminobacter carboxidus TaxID=376165 RepID=A0ABR9GWN5_9HYPH|nr:CopG family transcriptional regulator [Aminobacter carboxidus]
MDFADELDNAADRIADISRADLQIMLRRAALRLRNTEGIVLDEDVNEAVYALAADLKKTKQDLLRIMIREWLEHGGYLPVRAEEEEAN